MKILRTLLLTLTVYGFAGWFYIVLNAVFHPWTLDMPLTHLLPYPREDTFGIICFIVSMLSFFAWNLTRDGRK